MPYPPNPRIPDLDITEVQPDGGPRERCRYCGNFTNRDRYGIPQCCDDAQWDALED